MKIFLMRHGIVDNPKKLLYGRLPGFCLSEKGRQQIDEMAEILKGEEIGNIFASPLQRTRDTVRIICQIISFPPEQVAYENDLIEVTVQGDWWGKPADQFFSLPGHRDLIEPENSVQERMMRVFNKALATGDNFLIVSHSDPIMNLLYALEDKGQLQYDGEYIHKAEIIVLEKIDNDFRYIETHKPSFQEELGYQEARTKGQIVRSKEQ